MHKRFELAGKVFGKLTVLEFSSMGNDYTSRWLCQCECGKQKIIIGKCLVRGSTRSCGCMQGGRSGLYGAVFRSHGMTNTPLYSAWIGIKMRCHNPNNQDYRIYGGRGIEVCEHWRNSFEAFQRDMGLTWQAGLTLDRIDSNGHYEPGNCRWVPMSDQWKTRRSHGPKRADGSPSKTYPKGRRSREPPSKHTHSDLQGGDATKGR